MATAKTTTKKEAAKEQKNLEAVLYTQVGKESGSITLPESVFGLKWNADLVHQVATSMMANARAGTAHTKDRSDVSGGGKKPWKQKGTGRARHGSTRSPIWVGGGVTFGPRSDKDYSKKINKKMRAKALFTVLSKKFNNSELLFVDKLSLDAVKTKEAQQVLENLAKIKGFEKLNTKKKTGSFVVLPEKNEAVEKSFRNIPGVTVGTVQDLNVVSALHFKSLVFVGNAAGALEAKLK